MSGKIRVRTEANGKAVFYSENGAALKDIRSITYADTPDAVFTVSDIGGVYYVFCPVGSRNIKCTLEQAINKYQKTVYVVS